MDLRDYLRLLRKRWRSLVITMLVVLGLAAAVTIATPRTYAATTQFFVSTVSDETAGALAQGNTFTQQRVKSYAQVLQTPRVLQPVVDELGLGTTPETLANRVTATIPVDTVLIDVTVTADSADEATAIARAIDAEFPAAIADLEQVREGSSPVKVTVVREAVAKPGPVSPKPAQNLALGLVLGLLVGFGVAMLREVLDVSIDSEDDLAAVTESPVLGRIGYDDDAASRPLVVQVETHSPRAEAFRALRTNLRFVDAATHPRSIVITSSIPGEGKSTTTANLALTLAYAGAKVCVIGADLRRPRLLEYLGMEDAVGLTDILIGRAATEDVVQQFADSSLWVIGSGPVPPNPSELLGSDAMRTLIEELEATYDYVLIDASPLLPVTDAAVLATVVGGVLLVVGADRANRDHVRRSLESLAAVNANLLGVVFNRMPIKTGHGYYGSYHYYGYGPEETPSEGGSSPTPQRSRDNGPVTEGASEDKVPVGTVGTASRD